MGVTDILDLGNGMPLFDKFQYEDWTLLSTRYELHLLLHSFKKDLDDPDRPSFGEPWPHNWWAETMSQIQFCCIPRFSLTCLSSPLFFFLISFVCGMCHFYLNSSNFKPTKEKHLSYYYSKYFKKAIFCAARVESLPLFTKFSSTKFRQPPKFPQKLNPLNFLRGMELSTIRPWEVRRFIGCDPRHREHGPRIFEGPKAGGFTCWLWMNSCCWELTLLELNRFFVRPKSLRIHHWKTLWRWLRSCFHCYWRMT